MEKWASRRSKLDSIDPTHLLLAAREWLFRSNNDDYFCSYNYFRKLLASATSRGNEEACWIFAFVVSLEKSGTIKPKEPNLVFRDITELMISRDPDSPLAKYYRGMYFRTGLIDPDLGVVLLLQSAQDGFAPAMGELRTFDDWVKKAAELGDPGGIYQAAFMSDNSDETRVEMILKAARMGYPHAIDNLIFEVNPDSLDVVRMLARYMFIMRLSSYLDYLLDNSILRLLRNSAPLETCEQMQIIYVIGQELEGYEELWDKNAGCPGVEMQRCIDFYLDISCRARQTAVYTYLVFRRSLGRDIAGVVAKLVFGTRTYDAKAWCNGGRRKIRKV